MNNIELEKVETGSENSFACSRYKAQYFERLLHVHPEIEIVYIEEGVGECIVADNNLSFGPGDLFVFGGYLPHYFKSDRECVVSSSFYVQFLEDILPAAYTSMVGCSNIKQLIACSSRGMCWRADVCRDIVEELLQMQYIAGFERLNQLYTLLNKMGLLLSQSNLIASASYTLTKNTSDSTYHRIVEYINIHFRDKIRLEELAAYAHMNSSAMCRYFRRKSGQSIFNYLIDVRIAIAKEELATTDTPVAKIAYDVGFSCVSNFNTQFKRITHLTPSAYRKQVR